MAAGSSCFPEIMHPRDLSIKDFSYQLPDDKIATLPLQNRDASKLLIYKNNKISEDIFSNLQGYLPPGSLLVFNDTKVINARILFTKTTGAAIEVFCLEPADDITEYQTVLGTTGAIAYKCFVGGASKWKNETLQNKFLIAGQETVLHA
ncbi:MAG: S-adenosylmethionine:tRNA ribosyltransferase-isomerase, partial [Ferruginibacter sp.]